MGTIGYGGAFNMGKAHLQQLLAHKGFVADAICDLDPSRLKVARDRELIITPEWSRRVIQVLDFAQRSALRGKAVKAKYA